MALSRKKLNQLMQDDEDRWEQDGISQDTYDDMGLGGRDVFENFENALKPQITTNDDITNSPAYDKYTQAMASAMDARSNPIAMIKQGLSSIVNAIDSDGEKALLTEEQKTNYANNNLSNLSEDTINKLKYFSANQENTSTNILNSLANLNSDAASEAALKADAAQDEQDRIKKELQEELNIDDETFKKYVASASYLNNLEERKKQQEDIANMSTGEKAVANVGNVLLSPVRSLVDAAGYLNEYTNPYRDENYDIDHNSAAFDITNLNNDTTNQTSKDIEEFTGADQEDASFASKAANFGLQALYQGGKSGLESLLRLGTVGQVGTLAEAGIEAYDNAREQAQERGLTKGQAIATATAQGMAEAAFEILPVDNLGKLFKEGGKAAEKGLQSVLKEIGKQSAFEGLEEIETNIANTLTDAIINKDKSEFNVAVQNKVEEGMSEDDAFKDVLKDNILDNIQSFLGGAIGGALGGGVALTSNVAQNAQNKKALEGNYDTIAASISDNVEDYNTEEEYKRAMEVKAQAQELSEQPKVTSAQRNELISGIQELDNMEGSNLIENINQNLNDSYVDVNGNYTTIASSISSNAEDYSSEENYNRAMEVKAEAQELSNLANVTEEQNKQLAKDLRELNRTDNTDLIQNINNTIYSPYVNVNGAQVAKNNIEPQVVAETMAEASRNNDVNSFVEAYRDSQASDNAEARKLGNQYYDTLSPKFDQAYDSYNNMARALGSRSAEDIENAVFNGEEIVDEELNTPRKQQAYERAQIAVKQIEEARVKQQAEIERKTVNPEEARVIETEDGNVDLADLTIDNSGNFIWKKGDEEVVIPNKNISDRALQTFRTNALQQPTVSAKQLYIDNYSESVPIGTYNSAFKSVVMAGATGQKLSAWKNTHKYYAQVLSEDALKAIYNEGKKTKKSKVKKKNEAQGRVVVDDDAKIDKNDPFYKMLELYAKKAKIDVHISKKGYKSKQGYSRGAFRAGAEKLLLANNNDVKAQTFIHEGIGEFLQAYNQEDMQEIQDAILEYQIETLGEEAVNKAIEGYARRYQNVDYNTYREAAGEYVNDSLAGLFATKKGTEDFVNWLSNEDKTLLQKIKDFINDLVEYFSNLIKEGNLEGASLNTAKMAEKRAKIIRQRIFDAMDKAIEGKETSEKAEEKTAASLSNDNAALSLDVETISSNENAKIIRRTFNDGSTDELIQLKKAPTLSDVQWNRLYQLDTSYGYGIDYSLNGKGLKKAVEDGAVKSLYPGNKADLKKMADILGLGGKEPETLEEYKPTDKYTEDQIEHYVEKAEDHFGTTYYYSTAGYLDVNGELLDFSEGQNYRASDHREISEILDLPEDAGYSDGLIEFMAMGNIRMQEYGIDIAVRPNKEQEEVLRDFFDTLDGEVTVDFSKPNGDSAGSASYREGTSSTRILDDIDNYFNTLEVPEGTDDGNTYFSLDVPVERKGNLIAVHNMFTDELLKTLELGGFPMPSIAIIKAAQGHFKYGNVSVVFYKDTIDPANNGNRVWLGDAYTPDFSSISIDYKLDTDKLRGAEKKVKELCGKIYDSFINTGFDDATMANRVKLANGDIVKALQNNEALEYAFVKSKGIKADIPLKEKKLSVSFENKIVEEVAKYVDITDSVITDYISYEQAVEKGVVDKIIDTINAEKKKRIKNKELYEALKIDELPYPQYTNLMDGVTKYHREGITQEPDRLELNAKVSSYVDNHQKEYDKWIKNLFKGVVEKKGIRNGVDAVTDNGSRSWEELYYDFNLDNLVETMRNGIASGKAMLGYSFLGSATEEVNSIDDIHNAEERLKLIDNEEYEKLAEDIKSDLYDVARQINRDTGYDVSSVESDIAEAVATNETEDDIRDWLSQWYTVTDIDMEEIMSLRERARRLPTGYFEAKPQRAVTFDEIAKIILPENTNKKIIKALEERNIPYETYEAGNEEDRLNKLNSVDDVAFSLDVDSEGNNLSQSQQQFFRNTKVVDNNGSLRVMYHGTGNTGFTVFDDSNAIFFTSNPDVAKGYSGTKDTVKMPTLRTVKSVIDAIKKDMDADVEIRKENGKYVIYENGDYVDESKNITDLYNLYSDYRGITGYGGNYQVYLNVVNPLYIDAKNETWETINVDFSDKPMTTNEIAEYAKNNGYDGVIIDNLYDAGLYNSTGEKFTSGTDVIVFNSNQIKLTSNDNPTGDNDIRYSLEVDSKGRELTPGQKKFFADETEELIVDGKLEVLYHGTPTADFTEFDADMSDDGISLFLTNDDSVASTYAGTDMYADPYDLPASIRTFEDLVREYEGSGLEPRFVDGKYQLVDMESEEQYVLYEADTIEELVEQLNYDMDIEEADGGIYEVYAHITNPLVIEGKNESWNNLGWETPEGETLERTREIAEYAHDNGYDGVIFNNIGDNGSYYRNNRTSKVVVAFRGEQIKSVHNENPTDNTDMRYSLDVPMTHALDTDDFFPFVDSDGSAWIEDKDSVSRDTKRVFEEVISAANEAINYKISDDDVKNIADKMIKEYDSDVDEDMVVKNLKIIFDLMQNGYGNYQEMTDALMNLAEEIVNHSMVENEVDRELYDSINSILNSNKFRLSENQKNEAVNSKDNWGGVFGRIGRFVNNSMPLLDEIYADIADQLQAIGIDIDRNVSDAEQPLVLADILELYKPEKVKNDFEGADITDIALTAARDIMYNYYDTGLLAKAGKAEVFNDVKKKLAKQNKEYQKKVGEIYQAKVREIQSKLEEEQEANRMLRLLNKEYYESAKNSDELKGAAADNKKLANEVGRLKREAERRARADRNSLMSYKNKKERTRQMAMIRKSGNSLYNMINRPTKTKFVPEMIQKPVLEMLSAIDFINYKNTNNLTVNQNDFVNALIEGDTIEEAYKKAYPYAENRIRNSLQSKGVKNIEEELNRRIKNSAQKVLDKPKVKQRYEELSGQTPYETTMLHPNSKTAANWQEKMNAVSLMLGDIQNENNYSKYARNNAQKNVLQNLAEVCAQEVKNNLDDFRESVANEKIPISRLSVEQLKKLNKFLKSLSASINNANRLFTIGGYADVDALGVKSLDEMSELKEIKTTKGAVGGLRDFFNLSMAQPVTFFEDLGSASKSVYNSFVDGTDHKMKRIKKAADDFFNKRKELKVTKDIPSWIKELHTFNFNEGQLQLTTPQIMYLYALNKREQKQFEATKGENGYHIQRGGVVAKETKVKLKDKKKYRRQVHAIHLTQSDVDSITETLSQKQKDLADYMAEYLAKECGEWGNNVSRKQYGYDKYTEDYYMPLITDKTSTQTNQANAFDEAALRSLANSSFSKELTPKADTPVVLSDIFDVFANHIDKMASYEAFVLPINDALRFLNFNNVERDEFGKRYDASVKKGMQRVLGDNGEEYFKRFIVNINGDTGIKSDLKGVDSFLSYNKAQAVMANMRVVLQQFFAYPKAIEVIDNKYLLKALAMTPASIKKYSKKSQEKSGLAWLKAQGYYDTNIGQSFKKLITGISTPRETINSAAGYLAGAMDNLTWGALYRASELKVKDDIRKNKENISDAEFDKRVLDVFNEIIVKTQVVDSTITKSQLMRSKDSGTKLLTSFAAEPTTLYNMFHRGLWAKIQKKDNKKLFKNSLIILYSGLLLSFSTMIADAWRDDEDEDKTWLERLLDAWLSKSKFEEAEKPTEYVEALLSSDLFDAINPLNMLPVFREITTAFQGYDQQNMSTAAIYSVADIIRTFEKVASGESKLEPYGIANKSAKALSLVTGVPFASALREVKNLHNNFSDLWDGERWKSYSTGTNYTKMINAINDNEEMAETIKETKQKKIDEELKKGTAQADAEKKATSAVSGKITEKYKPQLLELKNTDMNAAIEMKKKLIEAYMAAGLTRDEANKRINKWK